MNSARDFVTEEINFAYLNNTCLVLVCYGVMYIVGHFQHENYDSDRPASRGYVRHVVSLLFCNPTDRHNAPHTVCPCMGCSICVIRSVFLRLPNATLIETLITDQVHRYRDSHIARI